MVSNQRTQFENSPINQISISSTIVVNGNAWVELLYHATEFMMLQMTKNGTRYYIIINTQL